MLRLTQPTNIVIKTPSRFSMLKAAFNRVLFVNPANLFVSVSLHVSDSDKPVELLPVILGVTIPCKLCYPDPVIDTNCPVYRTFPLTNNKQYYFQNVTKSLVGILEFHQLCSIMFARHNKNSTFGSKLSIKLLNSHKFLVNNSIHS